MALIVRIDVDRPYGKQGMVRHIASRLASDFALPAMPGLSYLAELKVILRALNKHGRACVCIFPVMHPAHHGGLRADGRERPLLRPAPGGLALL